MRIRLVPCFILLAAFLFLTADVKNAFAAPFSTSQEFHIMQRHRSKKDQRNRVKAIETYFVRKNPRVSQRNAAQYAQLIEEYASQYNLDPFLVASIMVKESTVKEKAVSKGNYGLMQINWSANRPWIVKTFSIRSTADLIVPSNNIRVGTYILASNIKKSRGDVDRGLDRYRGRSLASYRNSIHDHYLLITRIFQRLQPMT